MIRRIEITGELDRGAVEALCLEVRRLARRHGFDVTAVRVEQVRGEKASVDEGEEPEQEAIG